MKVSKKITEIIFSRDEKKELRNLNLKSGEALFKMLKMDFSIFELETLLFLDARNIELRVVEYVLQEQLYDEIEMLYTLKGLPILEYVKKFINSSCSEKEFLKVKKKLEVKAFKKAKELYLAFPFIQEKLREKNQKKYNYMGIRRTSKIGISYHPIKLS